MSVTVMRTWEKPSMGRDDEGDMGGSMPSWPSSSVPNDPTNPRVGSCSESWTRCSTRSTPVAPPTRFGDHAGRDGPPSGTFLVGYEEGRAVAIGGLRALATASARSSGCTWCPTPVRAGSVGRSWRRWKTRAGSWVFTPFGWTRGRSRSTAGCCSPNRLPGDPAVQREPHRGLLRGEGPQQGRVKGSERRRSPGRRRARFASPRRIAASSPAIAFAAKIGSRNTPSVRATSSAAASPSGERIP